MHAEWPRPPWPSMQWSRQGLLGDLDQPTLVTVDQVACPKKDNERDKEHDGRQDRMKFEKELAEVIGADPEGVRPQHRSRGVGNQKVTPGHAVHTGEESCQDPQQGNKTAEENDFSAVLAEQILADLNARF